MGDGIIKFGNREDGMPMRGDQPRIPAEIWAAYDKRRAEDRAHPKADEIKIQASACGDDADSPRIIRIDQVRNQAPTTEPTVSRREALRKLAQGTTLVTGTGLGYTAGKGLADHVDDSRKQERLEKSLGRQIDALHKIGDPKLIAKRRTELQTALEQTRSGNADLSKAPEDPADKVPYGFCTFGGTATGLTLGAWVNEQVFGDENKAA